MSGLEGILAITSLVLQVVSATDKVIAVFEKAQNAPTELGQLRASLLRLSRHFDMLRAAGRAHIHADDAGDVHRTLRECKALFDGYDVARARSSVHQVAWGTQHSAQVGLCQARVDRLFTQIVLPLWLETSTYRLGPAQHLEPVTPEIKGKEREESPQSTRPFVSPQHLEELSRAIEQLQSEQERGDVESNTDQLYQALRECWADMGLDVNQLSEIAGYQELRRNSTVAFEMAPATLKIEAAEKASGHRRIELERVHVMARDSESRILLYQSRDGSIQVTQIVQFGCIPWTSSRTSTRVSFLHPSVVTVIDKNGYHIYDTDPKYHFRDLDASHRFQETLRERRHLGAFDFVNLKSNGVVLARRQVIRFWTDLNKRHMELDLSRYDREAEFYISSARYPLRKPLETDTIIIKASLHSSHGVIRMQFESLQGVISDGLHHNAAAHIAALCRQTLMVMTEMNLSFKPYARRMTSRD
ncbi:unnamed protein product [Parascedosporium putredinis]|uniref:Fungal N-terminal domain-containing protein n=1 Tax=Parascedosporium putredinis TaxID=1442378 RepID=A0A9P1HAR2_9PEZI|nr:unnamed protein product [Parascedosporium putredinis]CAI8004251.1 unnamed protein product [Parascedosporium putredinis]